MSDLERCSFCGKARPEIGGLIAGAASASAPTVTICDGCVALCNEIVSHRGQELATPEAAPVEFVYDGTPFGWFAFPQKDTSVFLVVRRLDSKHSTGRILAPDQPASTELAMELVEGMREYLGMSPPRGEGSG